MLRTISPATPYVLTNHARGNLKMLVWYILEVTAQSDPSLAGFYPASNGIELVGVRRGPLAYFPQPKKRLLSY
jgi:hypothetical protein